MRALALAAAAILSLSVSAVAPAGPLAPPPSVAGGAAIVLVRGGCGPGFHRRRWIDRFGRWHIGCVPNHPVRRFCPPGMRLQTWRGPYGHWHRRCVPF